MAGRADEHSEAEGLILGERAGHSSRYPRRPHNADYEVHSPYNSEDSRGADPTPDTWRMEQDRLPDTSLICRAGFARRVYQRPSAGSGEDHTRSVHSKGKQRHLFYEQRAWEHQSPVRGPSYRHTDSLPTDPTWRPDLRGVEGILGRRVFGAAADTNGCNTKQ
ncbi:hypothetical protein ACLKA6_000630 [Drosophila palustris]